MTRQFTDIAIQVKTERVLVILPSLQELNKSTDSNSSMKSASYTYETNDVNHIASCKESAKNRKIE